MTRTEQHKTLKKIFMDKIGRRLQGNNISHLVLSVMLISIVSRAWGADVAGELAEVAQRDPIIVDVGSTYTAGSFSESVASKTIEKIVSLQWSAYDIDFLFTASYLNRTAPAGTIRTRINKRIAITPKLVSSSGSGDVLISANKEVFTDAATAIAINAVLGTKIAAADSAKGLGTGKNDYSLALTASYPFEKALLSGGTKYTKLGSPGLIQINGLSENIQLKNVWSGYLSLSTEFSEKSTTAITFTVEQPSVNGTSYYQVTEISSSYRINELGGVRVYVTKGANQSSPDWSAGVGLFSSF